MFVPSNGMCFCYNYWNMMVESKVPALGNSSLSSPRRTCRATWNELPIWKQLRCFGTHSLLTREVRNKLHLNFCSENARRLKFFAVQPRDRNKTTQTNDLFVTTHHQDHVGTRKATTNTESEHPHAKSWLSPSLAVRVFEVITAWMIEKIA